MRTPHLVSQPFPATGPRLQVLSLLAALLAVLSVSGMALAERHLRTKELSNVRAAWVTRIHDYAFQRIAVLPFANESDDPVAGEKVAQFIYNELRNNRSLHLLPPESGTGETLPELRRAEVGIALPPERLEAIKKVVQRRLSRALKAQGNAEAAAGAARPTDKQGEELVPEALGTIDAVLTGIVYLYRDREGGPLAVDSPAAVSYGALLISLRDGMVLWQAHYAETQEALFDNVLKMGRFLRGGAVWQRSDTLARLGTERVIRTFPDTESKAPGSN